MGEQYLTFTITSETPIDWAVGDFCVFRGETYTLNYVPSVTQKAGTKESQDAYTYENVKFESHQEELTRCIMLDITASTGLYIAALGTNYTGSSKFPLYCGETSVGGDTLTPVCALAAKMQANLDRMYGGANAWKIFVDTTTTFVNAVGDTVLVTHTDDKQLSFDNTTVAQALAEVHNTFDLDYCIRGRNIYIGYNLKNLTSDNDEETFAFGYGKGYPTHDDMNKGLFQIKRMANPQQKIVTRLRALGSTKNMPYRYYNKKYNLSQSLFPTNLQLPDTFETSATKATHNAQRDPSLSHVKGDTNDSYIDKNNNAADCAEGIREDCARWDGSNGDLVEIYPTIEGATYAELRGALVEDQDGNTGNGSFPNYSADERIDNLLAVGYKDGSTLVDDANKGDGILPESGISSTGVVRSADIGNTSLTYGRNNQFRYDGEYYLGKEHTLFTIHGVMPGKYAMAPTIGSTFFGFSLSCYRDGCSADVGFQIIIKQKNQQTGVVTPLATYTSDLESIERSDRVKEIELPELPDVVNGANAKVNEIRVTAMSDITVTFRMIMRNVVMPSGFTDDFSISYKVGNSSLDHSVTYEPEYTWFPVDDSDSIVDRFHVFIQDMGFDLEACWSDETPMLVMKSGRCVGREFEILQDIQKVTHNNKKGYMLTLKRAEDSSLNTYYPSQTDPIAADDTFVLLGIQMPDAYVKMAEVRLLRAATQYLADNCETKFTYQPSIDDIYLQRNYDNMVKAGTPNKSIFWRLYAGLKFTFRGVPTSEDSPAPLADITIEKVTISMGDGLTPKVELTLNDDVQQGTIQKLTTSVDRIYNGSIFASGSGNGATGAMSAALLSLLQSEGEKLFLSKTHDDTAEGKITFNDVVTHNETLKAKKGVKVGNFQSRLLGSGALIDEDGNAEFESIYSRNFISTPEFRFNRIAVTDGEQWCTNGYGTIKDVEILSDTTGYITLQLEENDYSSISVGDICRGIYNDVTSEYNTQDLDDDTSLYASNNEAAAGYGFSCKDGFFTSYFWVKEFVVNEAGSCKFLYELRNSNVPHPCKFMKFAQYGSFTNASRRSSSYSTSIGHYYEMVLDGVSTWKIQSANIVYRKGWLGNMSVTLRNGNSVTLQGYGLYAQDNVYFGNAIVQLDPVTLSDLESLLNNYVVELTPSMDVISVDEDGNCIGGLWTGSSGSEVYRLQSVVSVKKNNTSLSLAPDNDDADTGTYKISVVSSSGCTCVLSGSTIKITGIDNIKSGVSGVPAPANYDRNAMLAVNSCSVTLNIDCEGNGSVQKTFKVGVVHNGANGVIYTLMPSLRVVHKDGSGNFIDTTMALAIKRVVGASAGIINQSSGYSAYHLLVKYSRGDSSTKYTLSNYFDQSVSDLFGNDDYITLYLYDSTNNNLLDELRINAVSDGTDGENGDSVYIADLNNEIDSISCDETGHPVSSQSVSTDISLYYGTTKQTINTPTVKRNGTTMTLGTASNGVTASYSNGKLTISYTTAATISNKDLYEITITKSGSATTWQLIFTVNGILGDVYNLLNNVDAIRSIKGTNGNYTYDGTNAVYNLSCGYTKNVNGNITTVNEFIGDSNNNNQIDGKYQIFFAVRYRDTQTWQKWNGSDAGHDGETLMYSRFYGANMTINGTTFNRSSVNVNTFDAVKFIITPDGESHTGGYANNNISIIDEAIIPIIADGSKGDTGDGGVCYSLLPSESQIKVSRTSNGGYDPSVAALICGVVKSVGEDLTTIADATGTIDGKYKLFFRRLTSASFSITKVSGSSGMSMTDNGNNSFTLNGGRVDSGVIVYKVTIVTSVAITLNVEVSASSEGDYDFGAIGTLDSTALESADYSSIRDGGTSTLAKASGTSSQDAEVSVPAGTHFFEIGYYKDGSQSSNNDNAVFQFSYQNDGGDSTYRNYGQHRSDLQSLSTSVYQAVEFYLYKNTGSSDIALSSWDDTLVVAKSLVSIVCDGVKGDTGLTGCRERVFESYTQGQTYYNQENENTPGVRYVDFIAIEDNTKASGYAVYMCAMTHEATASTFNGDSSNWTEVSINAASAYFKYIIAKNANIKILSSAQFTIVNSDGTVAAGFANGEIPFWIGHATPGSAPFRVTRAGKVYANGGEFTGNIFTPYQRITSSNQSTYTKTYTIGGTQYKEIVLAESNSIQIEVSINGNVALPYVSDSSMLGCELSILNLSGASLDLVGGYKDTTHITGLVARDVSTGAVVNNVTLKYLCEAKFKLIDNQGKQYIGNASPYIWMLVSITER